MKIVINRDSVGFEDVEDAGEGEVAQLLDLTEAQVTGGQRIALRFVRFQNVSSLHVGPLSTSWILDCWLNPNCRSLLRQTKAEKTRRGSMQSTSLACLSSAFAELVKVCSFADALRDIVQDYKRSQRS